MRRNGGMKKMDMVKTIELIAFAVIAVIAIVFVVSQNGRNVRVMNLLLWLSLAMSFFFILYIMKTCL